jgi:hypothetical protein
MPSINPRIAVYLPKHVAATVQRLAGLRGVSRSAVIREFLIEADPVMQRIANLLDLAARSDRTALKEWARGLEGEQAKLEESATGALAVMDRMESGLEVRSGTRRRRVRRTPGQ